MYIKFASFCKMLKVQHRERDEILGRRKCGSSVVHKVCIFSEWICQKQSLDLLDVVAQRVGCEGGARGVGDDSGDSSTNAVAMARQ